MATPAQTAANEAARKAAQRSPLLKLAPFEAYADPVCALKDPRLVALHDYWRGKRGSMPIPARENIHPRDFVNHLPRIFLHSDCGSVRLRTDRQIIARRAGASGSPAGICCV